MRAGMGALALGAACSALSLTGCASGGPGSGLEGECTVRVLRDGQLYRAVNPVRTPRPGSILGEAVLADCAGDPIAERDPGVLFTLPGTATDQAVLLRQGRYASVYVNVSVAPAEWPDIVKSAGTYPTCRRAASFTGTWDLAGAAGELGGDYRIELPYLGSFTAIRGKGLQFDRWSRVELDARVTDSTAPEPSRRLLEQALRHRKRVHVTTTCRGDRFAVSTVRLAATSPTHTD